MASILTTPIRRLGLGLSFNTCCVFRSLRFLHSAISGVRVRFAPSPTGDLHLGGLRTALYNYLFAKANHGSFILRIEDTDRTRLVAGAVDKLIDMLQWAGLEPDESPAQGGDYGPYVQSQRVEIYHNHVEALLTSGAAYRCFCSEKRLDLIRRDAVRRGEVPKYDNRCRHLKPLEISEKLANRQPYTIRLKLEPTNEPWHDLIHGPVHQNIALIEGDPILIKSDGFPTYHFACVVDDHAMRISHVLRGEEWLASTGKHVLLHEAFGWTPPKYAHLPLLLNSDGTKLSKRQGDISVESFRNRGFYPESLLNLLTKAGSGFGGRDTVGMDLEEMIEQFSLESLSPSSGRLQTEFLDGINRTHLKKKLLENQSELMSRLETLVGGSSMIGSHYTKMTCEERSKFLGRALEWGQARINRVEDLTQPDFRFLWLAPEIDVDWLKSLNIDQSQALSQTLEKLRSVDHFHCSIIGPLLKEVVNDQGYKMPPFMKVLRMALCGLKQGPPIAEVMELLGREEVFRRIEFCHKSLDP